jgi:hypothetical protein
VDWFVRQDVEEGSLEQCWEAMEPDVEGSARTPAKFVALLDSLHSLEDAGLVVFNPQEGRVKFRRQTYETEVAGLLDRA